MSTSNEDQPSGKTASRGVLREIGRDFRAQRKKGLIRQQRDMAVSERQVEFISETKGLIQRVLALKVAPTRVETFEAAVKRLRLSDEFLEAQMQRHKSIHLALYMVAGALLVYGFWMYLNTGVIAAMAVLVAASGATVNGYLHGYRAWQIENRNLIRLQDAVRMPSTYLVL
ncbi:hypothetical protein [Paucibacter soli]|uniref:hypothetical protein n=1 Tax=Paucibacter soli TaxID=3133433 RepID=UPI0030AE0490